MIEIIFLVLAFIGLLVVCFAAFIVIFNWYCNSRFNSLNKKQ
jgi:hypothetical protein